MLIDLETKLDRECENHDVGKSLNIAKNGWWSDESPQVLLRWQ
jgi:hypothetical protein